MTMLNRAVDTIRKWLLRLKSFVVANRLFVALFVVFLLIYTVVPILQHLNFKTTALDLGDYDQSVWLYSHFKFQENTLLGVNILGDHFEPILPLISPLYWFWSSPIVLLLLQGIVFCFGVVPVYLLAKERLGRKGLASLVAFSYLAFFGAQKALFFDFHPIVLAASLLSFAFYFMERGKKFAYFVVMVLALLCKETVAIYVVFLGLYLLLFRPGKRAWGLSTILMGGGIYLLAMKVVLPLVLGRSALRHFPYAQIAQNEVGVVAKVFTDPLFMIKQTLFPIVKLETIVATFAAFGFLPLLSWPFLLLIIPNIMEKYWSNSPAYWSMEHQYLIIVTPFLAYATLTSLVRILNNGNTRIYKGAVVMIIVGFLGLGAYNLLGRIGYSAYLTCFQDNKVNQEMVSLVPKDAVVMAQSDIVPHLAQREKVYEYKLGNYQDNDAEYIVLNIKGNKWRFAKGGYKESIQYLLDSGKWTVCYSKGSGLVLRRGIVGKVELSSEAVTFLRK